MMANQSFTINIKALFDASQVTSGAKQIQDIFKNIKLPSNLQSDFQKAFSNLENSVSKVQQKYEQGFKTKGDVSSFEKSFKEMENAAAQYEKVIQRIQAEVGTSVDLSKLIKWDDSTLAKLKAVDEEIKRIKSTLQFNIADGPFSKIEKALNGITSNAPKTTEAINNFKKALISGDLQGAEEQLTKLESIWSRFKGKDSYNAIFGENGQGGLRELFNQLKETGVFAELEKLQGQRGEIQTAGWEKMVSLLRQAGVDVRGFNGALGQTKSQISNAASAQQAWNSQLDQFKSRIQYFFGLNNVIQLVRRSLREAFNTVKELDDAMAQTAVVTNYTISDMWNQLPKYTSVANELGVTTKGAYETMTLFYQQGLDSNKAFALGTETMKMARIAGLDYATATDYMTAALRGFNMELTELSAQRVNDVYSRLAAVTASNTQEISTAMTKVASLAHNANMEFETTSAFLAQIIETTRESAETAGTALKTVVARFSEVKKLYSENTLKGQDEEGEIIDVNKVSTALRTAGIDMNKYFLGEVGLDDIFMELASKWDSLTAVQQRYIATQAAGSRQQSRFIAMMSNYSRTQELVAEAYNSTGASEKQFEKTQASLETALNRLNNAWDQFIMNLANETAIKSVINLLTDFLNVLNKITGVFSGGWRSVITGGLALGGLFGGGKLVNAAFSASKIAKANNIAWGTAFKNQLSNNPMLYSAVSGELIQQDGVQQYGQRFHLFGKGGFFNPADTYLADRNNILKGQEITDFSKLDKIQRYRRTGGGIAAAGLAFSAAGSAISQNAETIATSFDTSTESVEKFGKELNTLGTTASIAGSMLMLLPPGLNVVAAALVGLIGIVQAFRGETQGETLKRLSDETNKAETTAKNAKQAYDDLLSGAATHDELLNKISKLKEGTLEFRKAVLEANQAALDLINNYGISKDQYIRDKNGLITFNSGVIQKVQEQQLEAVEKAQENAVIARLNEDSQRAFISKNSSRDTGEEIIAPDGTIYRPQKMVPNEDFEELNLQGQESYYAALQGLFDGTLNDATKLAIEYLTSEYDSEAYSKRRAEVEKEVGKLSDSERREEYKEKFGAIPDNLGLDEITDAITQARIAEELRTKVTDKANNIYQGVNKQVLKFSKYSMKELLDWADETTEEQSGYNRIASQYAQRVLAKVNDQFATYTDLPQNLQLGSFALEDVEKMGNIAEKFGTVFGSKSATVATQLINNELINNNHDLINSLSQINFGQAVSSNLKQIKDLGEESGLLFSAAFEDAGGNAGIFQSLYYNNQDIIDGFKETADAMGDIPIDVILDAADNCTELADALEISEFNAAGLAAALEEINLDHLNAEQLTDNLLKAFSAAEDVNQILAEGDNFLDNWKEVPSGDRFAKWAAGGAKSITEAWNVGRYQDGQARQYLETILGSDFMRTYNQVMSEAGNIAYNEGPDAALAHINEGLGREIQLMTDLASAENLQPLYQYFEDTGKILADGAITFKDGMVHFDDEVIKTASDARQALLDSGINENLANLMISDYMQNSPDAIIEWNKNAAQLGLDAFKTTLEQGGTVLQGELDTYFDKYKQYFSTDEEWKTWKNTFENEISQYDGKVINLKVDWTTSEDPIKALEKAFGGKGGLKNYFASNGVFDGDAINGVKVTNLGSINLDQIISQFKELGATEAQAMALAQQYADETGASFRAAYDKWDFVQGKTKDDPGHWEKSTAYVKDFTSAVEAAAAAEEAASQSLQEMQSEILQADISTGIKQAFGSLATDGAEIKFVVNSEEVDSYEPEEKEGIASYSVNSAAVDAWIPPIKYGKVVYSGAESEARGGIVGSYASGSASNHISPGPALTGEEGPEIIWNKDKGYAYITGERHPEFQNLQPGDRVFNAQETKKILGGAASGGKIPSLATGYLPGIGGSSGGSGGRGSGGGSGDDKTPEEWKNDLDWLYNLMEDIVELERDQKAIEEQYEDYLSDQTKTGGDLYRLLVQQLGNLYTQLNHQTFALEKREQEMREFMDVTNDQDQYLWYNWQDRTLEIDWDAIDQITDEEQYKHVKELIDQAEEIQDKIDDADDAVMDITNQIQELENVWRDTFTDFEDRVLDAIVKSYQQVIDKYSELNDTLNNSNTQILDSLQKQISLSRQIRDNTKTEEEISDEEARLAYLRRDTSGGNDLAALQLERELDDQRKNYEDTLVDQAISRLQEDNDAAAQQRERQIEIMQAQLDYQSENGEFNAYISELLSSAMGADGELLTNSDLVALLKEQENWDAMSAVSKQVWEEELNGTFKEVAAFLLKQNAEQNGTFYTALTEAVKSVSTAIGSYSQAMVKLGSSISSGGSSGGGGGGSSSSTGPAGPSKAPQSNNVYKAWTSGDTMKLVTTPGGGYYYETIKKHAKGGLNTQTGLAWLDGTPSEPEYVLNARQTDAFLRLADVLPSMMNGTSNTTSNAFGATYVNFSVNLESVSPDYDVDRMVDLVKDKLYDSATYRNNNVLSFLR